MRPLYLLLFLALGLVSCEPEEDPKIYGWIDVEGTRVEFNDQYLWLRYQRLERGIPQYSYGIRLFSPGQEFLLDSQGRIYQFRGEGQGSLEIDLTDTDYPHFSSGIYSYPFDIYEDDFSFATLGLAVFGKNGQDPEYEYSLDSVRLNIKIEDGILQLHSDSIWFSRHPFQNWTISKTVRGSLHYQAPLTTIHEME